MRSPLECIEGSFSSAVFTTYSLNLRFFEHWVMPLLHAAGVRNVIVLADESQLGAALEDHGLRGVGRSYHVVSTRLGPGAFHPKLIFLSGEHGVRACVSSANLTVDGQLRNVEAAILLDSQTNGHTTALADAAEFLRRCAVRAPAHTVDALLAALPAAPNDHESSAVTVRLVHNLDQALLGTFPSGDLTAVSPYADAGQAATALGELGALTVVTDGDTFAAPESFFAGSWTVVPRKVRPRRLHGKAYWSKSWLMVGSPNLSAPALLQTAANGNTELAVMIDGDFASFTGDLPGSGWTDRPLQELAPARHRLERLAQAELERVGSFDAWEDESEIVVAGIDDLTLEHWNPQTSSWEPLGKPVLGRLTPPPGTRPHLLRCRQPNGRVRQAVVHRTRVLRSQRERPRTTSRGAQALSALPLDFQGVKALEDVLHDLYALEALTEEGLQKPEPSLPGKGGKRTEDTPETLTDWRPAREDDEPRVPDLYRRAWSGEPDTLLALIRKALRLDEQLQPDDEAEVLQEKAAIDQEEADEVAVSEIEAEQAPPPPELPRTTTSVLQRYRGALLELLDRGGNYILTTKSPVLADLGFVAILRLHEELGQTLVSVDDKEQPLVDPSDLMEQKVKLLDAYLRKRSGRDVSCLATARAHLGLCLVAREQLTPLSWETLEALAHRYATDLLAENPYAERAAQDAEVDPVDLELRIRPYAERADWGGFVVEAETHLDRVDCGEDPFPWVSGADWFATTTLSPAWKLAAHGAIAGFQNRQRYGVFVRNQQPQSAFAAHIVVVDPATSTIYEAFKRSSNGTWVSRSYTSASEGSVVKTGAMGPDAILEDCDRSSYADLDVDGGRGEVILELLEAVGEVAART